MFAGVFGGYLMCVHPDGKSVFILNSTDFVRIDLKTGNQFFFNQFLLDKLPNDTYKYLHSIFRSQKAFILALTHDKSTEKYYLTSHLIGERNTSLASRNGIDIFMEPSKYKIYSGIIEDENGEMYCIITWWYNNNLDTKNFHAVKIGLDNNGIITQDLLVTNRSLRGPYVLPFIRSGASIWQKKTWDWSTLAGQQLVRQVPLNDARNNTDFGSDEKMSVSDHQNTTNMVITSGLDDFPATMGDKIFYTFSASVSMEISLNYLDWKRRTWRILHFKAKEHLLELSFNSPNTTVRGTADSKAYLHGDCGWSQQIVVDKFCLYEIDVQAALKQEDDNFDKT